MEVTMPGNLSIRSRLIVSAAAIIILSAVVLGAYSYQSQVRQLQRRFADLATNNHRLFTTILAADAEGLNRALTGLSRLEMLLEPFAATDRDTLLNAVKPIFAGLKAEHNITHMYFIGMDGRVFLRAHKPEQHGDLLERATYVQAAATRSTASGLEMGKNFFSLRCVTPVYFQGRQIGYMEVAEEIDHVFERMQHISGLDFGLFLPADYIRQYQTSLRADIDAAFAQLYLTNPEITRGLVNNAGGLLRTGLELFTVERIQLNSDIFLVGVSPIRDAFGEIAGVLWAQRKVTLLFDALWRSVMISLGCFIAILIIGNVLLFLSMQKSFSLFNRLQQHIQNVTRTWDLSSRMTVDTEDEIGELAKDFNRMQDEMNKMKISLEQRARELGAANRDLESFGYSLSHDLRLPLTKIISAVDILRENYADRLDDTGRFLMDSILSGSEGMEELIEAIMTLAKSGRKDLAREPVDLAEIGREVIADCRLADPDRDVTLDVPNRLPVEGDAHLLRVALTNLLENAWKYTRMEAAARIELGTFEQNGKRVFFVRDNGMGFDMQEADKLFQPFQRLDNALSFKGTGIGLATVRKIIQRHGGTIWAKGKQGEGATIYFTLN